MNAFASLTKPAFRGLTSIYAALPRARNLGNLLSWFGLARPNGTMFRWRRAKENSNSGRISAVSHEPAIIQIITSCHPGVSSRIRIYTQCCELLRNKNLPVMPVPVLLIALHICRRSEPSIKPLAVIFAVAVEFPMSTRPAVANVCHLDDPTVAFRAMPRAVDRGFSVEEVIVERSVRWHAGG